MPRAAPAALPAPDLDALHDAGFAAASARAEAALATTPATAIGRPIPRDDGAAILVGTASWTDPTITRGSIFYPRGVTTAEARLRWYASQFPVVEVDSSYYSLPVRATAQLWADRTPPHFIFHLKAHALMTGQPTEVARLPEPLVDALPAALADRPRVYAKDLPPELHDAVWESFLDAVGPLRVAGKLGGILLQYPRWFLPTPESKAVLADAARRLGDVPGAVELRNRHWFDEPGGPRTTRTLALLRDLGLTHVMVDGPRGLESSVPAIAAVTTPTMAVVRLHGRRAATWEAPRVPTVERYRYLYDGAELAALVPKLETLSTHARRTTVFLNNCYGNYGTTNARELVAALT